MLAVGDLDAEGVGGAGDEGLRPLDVQVQLAVSAALLNLLRFIAPLLFELANLLLHKANLLRGRLTVADQLVLLPLRLSELIEARLVPLPRESARDAEAADHQQDARGHEPALPVAARRRQRH